jgi:hypothetical protein
MTKRPLSLFFSVPRPLASSPIVAFCATPSSFFFLAVALQMTDFDSDEDEWMQVYNAGEHDETAKPQLFKDVKGDTLPEYNKFKYYQTFGGGPEGGYITNGIIIAKVKRSWGTPFIVEVIKGTLIFRSGNSKEGRVNAIKLTLSK